MNEVFIIGFSLGAAIAIGAASADTDHDIRGIVVDQTIPYKHSEQIFERLDTFKELWLVEGTGHTKAFSSSPAEYVRRVVDFFNGIRARGHAAAFPSSKIEQTASYRVTAKP